MPVDGAGSLSLERVIQRDVRALRPWTPPLLSRLITFNAIGLVLIVVSWYQVSGDLTVRDQLAWFNVGVVGLIVSGVGNGYWLLSGRSHIGRARMMVLPPRAKRPGDGWGDRLAEDLENRPVAAAAMTRYHRPSCPMVAGKQTAATTRRAHERAGRLPCELCEP
ncbi:MAG TPA: hypothetical protein VHV76_04415 [Mycobacteriales bacterium]|nr:hypothetical protein [Mycobacteriales bacterium]